VKRRIWGLVFLAVIFVSGPVLSAKRQSARNMVSNVDPMLVKKSDLRNNMKITVVGRLRQVGNVPFTSFVITPPSNFDIFIDEDSVGGNKNIEALQYKIVKASGTIRVVPLRKDEKGVPVLNRYTIIVNDIHEYKGEYKE